MGSNTDGNRFNARDEKLPERLQSSAVGYFIQYANPDNGLMADSSKQASAAGIGATGFALSCYPIAVERGWFGRKEAAG